MALWMVYKCDRCGDKQNSHTIGPQINSAPVGWVAVTAVNLRVGCKDKADLTVCEKCWLTMCEPLPQVAEVR